MDSKLKTLKQFINGDWFAASVALDRPEQTLRTRIRSGKDWRVMKIGKGYRCILVDEPPKR